MRHSKYRLIFILIVLITGLFITGWSVSTHHDHITLNNELRTELKKDINIDNAKSRAFSNNGRVLFLFSTGLIGLLGVRRRRKR